MTPPSAASVRDVQMVGLPFLYEALFAVANCRNVALDQAAFSKAARLYHLSPDDFTPTGDFAGAIASFDADDRVRLSDDRDAFCSKSRLSFAVPHGILIDLGPAVPFLSIPIGP